MGMTSMIVFWGAVIAFAVWAVKRFAGAPSENRASKILEERFAKGEIDPGRIRFAATGARIPLTGRLIGQLRERF
jgi:uncharacterized membrane protein